MSSRTQLYSRLHHNSDSRTPESESSPPPYSAPSQSTTPLTNGEEGPSIGIAISSTEPHDWAEDFRAVEKKAVYAIGCTNCDTSCAFLLHFVSFYSSPFSERVIRSGILVRQPNIPFGDMTYELPYEVQIVDCSAELMRSTMSNANENENENENTTFNSAPAWRSDFGPVLGFTGSDPSPNWRGEWLHPPELRESIQTGMYGLADQKHGVREFSCGGCAKMKIGLLGVGFRFLDGREIKVVVILKARC